MRWGSLRRYLKPPNRDGLRSFGAHNSLFLSPSYYSSPNLSPQFNIPRIANGSKQPPDPTPSTLCASFLGPQLYGPPYLFFGNSTTGHPLGRPFIYSLFR